MLYIGPTHVLLKCSIFQILFISSVNVCIICEVIHGLHQQLNLFSLKWSHNQWKLIMLCNGTLLARYDQVTSSNFIQWLQCGRPVQIALCKTIKNKTRLLWYHCFTNHMLHNVLFQMKWMWSPNWNKCISNIFFISRNEELGVWSMPSLLTRSLSNIFHSFRLAIVWKEIVW